MLIMLTINELIAGNQKIINDSQVSSKLCFNDFKLPYL